VFGARSILLLDGAEHLRQRRLMLPPFKGSRLPLYAGIMREIVDEQLERWPLGEPFALHPYLQEITLQVIMRTVFGFEDPARRKLLRDALIRFIDTSLNPWAGIPWLQRDLGDWSPWGRFLRATEAVDEIIFDEIERRRAEPGLEAREDVFSALLLARDEEGEPMTPRELRDEMLTLLLAGHETTATALAWGFMHLLRRPESLARAVDEARTGETMEFAEAISHETLRLRPPLPVVGRKLAAPATVAGYDLPAGVMLAPCIYLVHRREDLYPHPYAFMPERFLEQSPETYTWLPFGGGVRRCLGGAFAIYEMKVLLHGILSRAVLQPVGERELMRRRAIVFAPERGAQALLSELRPPAAEPAAVLAA
jgi:cytochrome P450